MFNGERLTYDSANNHHQSPSAPFNLEQRYNGVSSNSQIRERSTSTLNPNAAVFQPSVFTGRVYENLSFISVSGDSLRGKNKNGTFGNKSKPNF